QVDRLAKFGDRRVEMTETNLGDARDIAKDRGAWIARAQAKRSFNIRFRLLESAKRIIRHGARHIEQNVVWIDGEAGLGGAESFAGTPRHVEILRLHEVCPDIVGVEPDGP